MFQSIAISNKGLVRANNEDNILFYGECIPEDQLDDYCKRIEDNSPSLLAGIFDGMGGQNAGEKASLIAARLLKKYYDKIQNNPDAYEENMKLLNEYVEVANRVIFKKGQLDENCNDMGTTFACLYLNGQRVAVINAGDSNAYLCRHNALTQLNEEHTEAERLVRLGIITKEQSKVHKGKNFVTRYLGADPEQGRMEPFLNEEYILEDGDIFLLCTDGLTDMLSGQEILDVIQAKLEVREIGKVLVDRALEKGGLDNITLICIKHVKT